MLASVAGLFFGSSSIDFTHFWLPLRWISTSFQSNQKKKKRNRRTVLKHCFLTYKTSVKLKNE